MPGVFVTDSDSFDYALRKFKKQVEKAGVLSELKKRQHYEKPSIQKKKKEAAARKRLLKKLRKMQGM
ncbi:MAG TPA: 30S ribosomal protein S21 [Desulfomicrobiaceae bacterium]|nr:30S ribosomal protein S21 [Desulfomicrobiaceae bacterium]HCF04921.1 30S ribosomal protein S21 [Desulfomicrobiaceae bacterium]